MPPSPSWKQLLRPQAQMSPPSFAFAKVTYWPHQTSANFKLRLLHLTKDGINRYSGNKQQRVNHTFTFYAHQTHEKRKFNTKIKYAMLLTVHSNKKQYSPLTAVSTSRSLPLHSFVNSIYRLPISDGRLNMQITEFDCNTYRK